MNEQETETNQTLDNLDALDSMEAQESAELLQALEDDYQNEAGSEAAELPAAQGAAFAVGMVETLIKLKWSYVEIAPEVKAQVSEKAVPVFKKWGVGDSMPEWLQPWREEVELGIVVAVAGFGIYSQVNAHEAAEQDEEKNEPEAGQSKHAA